MIKKFVFILGVVLAFVTVSCDKPDETCEEDRSTAAFVIDHPDSIEVGLPFLLNIDYVVENSCGDFGSFEGDKIGNTLEVRLIASYIGCDCDPEFVEKSATYPVIFDEVGTYELKFWVAENEFDTYVIDVYE